MTSQRSGILPGMPQPDTIEDIMDNLLHAVCEEHQRCAAAGLRLVGIEVHPIMAERMARRFMPADDYSRWMANRHLGHRLTYRGLTVYESTDWVSKLGFVFGLPRATEMHPPGTMKASA